MPRVALLGAAYGTRSIIASAQRSVNLYSEKNPPDGSPPVPATCYPTPGLSLLAQPPNIEAMRSIYRASNGNLYVLVGPSLYAVSNTFAFTLLGTLPDSTTPVSWADNGLAIVVVDGTTVGYAIDMTSNAFATISDPVFYGARSAAYQDTYFIFNRPGTAQFYISLGNATFNMLTGIVGAAYAGTIGSGGTLYVSATYTAVPLTGGTGTGAQATIVVTGGIVTQVTITAQGSNYLVGDVLSASNANLGGAGSGFSYTVNNVHGAAFRALDIAAKTGSADNIVAAPTVHGELWLIGDLTTEIWYDVGAADFAYQRIQGAFVDHGCAAPYSIAQIDINLLWLSQDRQGNCIVVKTEGYSVVQISTHALEQEFQTYSAISDAIGYCHQIEGHAFYVLTFPTADKTYCYDLSTGQWHQRASIDANGVLHRHRSNCFAFAYGYNLVGDYQNGNLYSLTNTVFTDNGTAIPRIRTLPHISVTGKRKIFRQLQADIAAGMITGGSTATAPQIYMRFSADKGFTYGNPVAASMGGTGQYVVSPQWNQIGIARDGVFELSWSSNTDTALNGAWVRYDECNS